MSYVEHTFDSNGDLFLKYFLADTSRTKGNRLEFEIDNSAIDAQDQYSVGIPFTLVPDKKYSLFGDYHPWSLTDPGNLQSNIEYANKFKIGEVKLTTKDTALRGAAIDDIKYHNGRFAVVKITDPKAKTQYSRDPSSIPKNVSPGIFDLDFGKYEKVKNFRYVHLAAVPKGAFGDKATLYGTCMGAEKECLNHLKGAAYLVKEEHIDTEKALQEFSSLGSFEDNSSDKRLSSTESNTNNNPTTVNSETVTSGSTQTDPNTQTVITETKNANTESNNSPIRLKTQLLDTNKKLTTVEQKPDFKDTAEYKKLIEEQESIKKKIDLQERQKAYASIIPKELFIDSKTGKFNSQGFEKEINTLIEKGYDPEHAKELYNLRLQNAQLSSKLSGKPYGASTLYETPSDVPELKGAGAKSESSENNNSSQFDGIKNLCRMFGINSGGVTQ